MTCTTVGQLREGFHYPTIENQPGLPTYSTINTIQTPLKHKCSFSAFTTRRGKTWAIGITPSS